jgi:hypothetical protein
MPRLTNTSGLAAAMALSLCGAAFGQTSSPAPSGSPASADVPATITKRDRLPSLAEARDRAALLHETMHATLQIVHHEYFREGETIPAATLKRVFREIAKRQQVELRWLAVNAQAMNTDHEAQNAFETQAAKALGAGEESFELAEEGRYRRAGAITLASDCLKCHLPNRTSTRPRTAALIITMAIANP